MCGSLCNLRIVIRGAGEMASGTAVRLIRSGFGNILMTEMERPISVRRMVSFSEAVYDGKQVVEGIKAVRIEKAEQAEHLWAQGLIPVIVDRENACRAIIRPHVVIDAMLAKRNLGTSITDADLVVALGPGFRVGLDAHYVVETNRGHDLGRLIEAGIASPNTGNPGDIAGHTVDRVLRAPADGVFRSEQRIGDMVEKGQTVGHVGVAAVKTGVNGVLRGLIRPGAGVTHGLKVGDVDPRGNPDYCRTISEKARAIGGTVLEAIMMKFNIAT